MTDTDISRNKDEQKASQNVEKYEDPCTDASNALQKSPQVPQSEPIKKDNPAKDQLEEDVAQYRKALTYGPTDPNARFWAILATSRRNRFVSRVSKRLERSECAVNQEAESKTYLAENKMRKTNALSNVSSGEIFGKASFGAEPLHPPEPDIRPTPSRHHAVTILEVYNLLLGSWAKLVVKFRAKNRKERQV